MSETNYFSRSWSLLTRDKGWIKPVLVMAAADLVPIVGALGTHGYILEWARLTAWGVDAAPKQKGVNIGDCLMSGLRALVVIIGWSMVFSLVTNLVPLVALAFPEPLDSILSLLFSMVILVASVFYGVVLSVAQIRTAIYENIGAGYRVDRIFEMIKRDFKGFCMLLLINLAFGFILWIIIGIAVGIGIAFFMPLIIIASSGASVSSQEVVRMISTMVIPLCVFLGIFILVYGIANNISKMITNTANALWMRQFNVPAWGKSSDPLPDPASTGGFSSYVQYEVPMPQQAPGAEQQNVPPQATEQLPKMDAQPSPAPEPAPTPEPTPESVPEPWLAPEPSSEPVFEPALKPEPVPEAAPAPEPMAEPAPAPEPVPESAPVPAPMPEPEPKSAPAPTSEPEPADEGVMDDDLKDVDELYAELYDVIQRNNHADGKK